MPANRVGLTIYDQTERHHFAIAPTGKGGRALTIQTRPWEPGDPQQAWRIPLHPWDFGLGPDRLYPGMNSKPRTYAKANADTSYRGLLLFPPKVNSVTLSNSVTPTKATEVYIETSNSTSSKKHVLYLASGRYLSYFTPENEAIDAKDLLYNPYGKQDLEVFNGNLYVAMGLPSTTGSSTLTIASDAITVTANSHKVDTESSAASDNLVTINGGTTGQTITLSTVADARDVVVKTTGNIKTVGMLDVTLSTSSQIISLTYDGSYWNQSYSYIWGRDALAKPNVAWTQSSSVYADRLCRIGTRLYRASDTNKITGCSSTSITDVLDSSKWTTPSYVGDTTYDVNCLIDYGGVLWAGKADGMYSPDPNGLYVNQTPQLKSYPHPDNCKGAFTAQGYLFVPSSSGLIRIKPGQSKVIGPEISHRPNYRFWVRGGVEFGDAIYLLCTDEGGTQDTFICKMEYDETGQSGKEYIFSEWCRLGSTKGYFIAVSGKATNPELVVGYGNDIRYIKLGRGGGRDVDDANYEYGTSMELETGAILPGQDLGVINVLQGVTTVLKYPREGDALTVSYRADGESSYTEMLSSQEGGGIAPITLTDNYEAVTRFAPPTATGQFFEFKFAGSFTDTTNNKGTTRPEVREAWAFGYSRPRSTDNVSVTVYAGPRTAGINGIPNGKSTEETVRMFRHWMDSSTVIRAEVPEYEQGRPTRFLVTGVEVTEQASSIGEQHETSAQMVRVMLTRIDFAGEFANAN